MNGRDRRLAKVARLVRPGDDPEVHAELDRELQRTVAECERAGVDWREVIRTSTAGEYAGAAEAYIEQLEETLR